MPRFLITAIGFGLALLIGLVLLWPKYQDFTDLRQQIKKKNIELQYREEYFIKINEVSDELVGYESALLKIDSALPQNYSIPALFSFLEVESSRSGLILKEVALESIKNSDQEPEIKIISLEVLLSGSYPSLKDFFSNLENSARLLEVKNLSFSYPEEPEDPFTFQLLIQARSY
ncbi:MAG TPA: type 4a pilus biogenesis protein PilO [Candidatus Parcubacteria bacterium]|jgi:Tfp pilus assembly protein PilO|nr:type 4a pilus biogenesis protein PilO [Candidatus Parcubacteria bacterium]